MRETPQNQQLVAKETIRKDGRDCVEIGISDWAGDLLCGERWQ